MNLKNVSHYLMLIPIGIFSIIHKTINQFSHYYVEETFKEKIDAQFKGKEVFSLCHTNIRSLKAHIGELTDYFNSLSQ